MGRPRKQVVDDSIIKEQVIYEDKEDTAVVDAQPDTEPYVDSDAVDIAGVVEKVDDEPSVEEPKETIVSQETEDNVCKYCGCKFRDLFNHTICCSKRIAYEDKMFHM